MRVFGAKRVYCILHSWSWKPKRVYCIPNVFVNSKTVPCCETQTSGGRPLQYVYMGTIEST